MGGARLCLCALSDEGQDFTPHQSLRQQTGQAPGCHLIALVLGSEPMLAEGISSCAAGHPVVLWEPGQAPCGHLVGALPGHALLSICHTTVPGGQHAALLSHAGPCSLGCWLGGNGRRWEGAQCEEELCRSLYRDTTVPLLFTFVCWYNMYMTQNSSTLTMLKNTSQWVSVDSCPLVSSGN